MCFVLVLHGIASHHIAWRRCKPIANTTTMGTIWTWESGLGGVALVVFCISGIRGVSLTERGLDLLGRAVWVLVLGQHFRIFNSSIGLEGHHHAWLWSIGV